MRRLWPESPGGRAVAGVRGVLRRAERRRARDLDAAAGAERRGRLGLRDAAARRRGLRRAAAARRPPRDVPARPPRRERLDPGATIVLLDAPGLEPAERRALARFVRLGGRLVAGGAGRGRGDRAARAALVAERAAARAAERAGRRDARRARGQKRRRGALRRPARRAAGPRHAERAAGRRPGRARARAAARRRVAAAEPAARDPPTTPRSGSRSPVPRNVRSRSSSRSTASVARPGLAALPARWKLALALAIAAALVWLGSRARRFGPPEEAGEEPPPARREHVEALALALQRAREPHVALEAGAGRGACAGAATGVAVARCAGRAGPRGGARARLRGG